MADPTPLLTNPENSQSNESIEEIIEPYVTSLRWRQVLQIMLGFLPLFFEALQTFVSIFTETEQTWHCVDNAICNPDSDICQLPDGSWSWDKPAYASIKSEWLLVCENNSFILGLPTSSYFMGCIFTGFVLFFLGDSIGRKKMLFYSSLIMSVAAFCTAMSNNMWVYSGLRFMSGISRAAIGSSALVLVTESVGKQWQGSIGSVGFVVSTAVFLVLPGIAYSVRSCSWRFIYLMMSVAGIVYCLLVQLFAYESPKWLLAQGREQEAVGILKAFAGPKSDSLSWKFPVISGNGDQGNRKQSFFRILMESRALSRNFLLLLIIGFGIGLVYYGVALSVANLDFDTYWSAAYVAWVEILTLLTVFFTITLLQRRVSILGFTMLSGVCCLLLVCNLKELQVGFEEVSFFSASTAYAMLLIYTAELFPIYVRNSAVAMVWQVLMLGSVISPVLNAAGENNYTFLSYGIFGISVMATGVLVVFLPEGVEVHNPVDAKDEEAAKQVEQA